MTFPSAVTTPPNAQAPTASAAVPGIEGYLDTLAMLGMNGELAAAQMSALVGAEQTTASVLLKDRMTTATGASGYSVRVALLTATRILLWQGVELTEESPEAEAALEAGQPVPTYIRSSVRVVPLRAVIDVRVNMLTHAPAEWTATQVPANWVLVDFITAEQGTMTFRTEVCDDGCGSNHGEGFLEHDGVQLMADTDAVEEDVAALLSFAAAVSTTLATA